MYDDDINYDKILGIIKNSSDPLKLTSFAQNAQKKNVIEVRDAARAKLKTLLPQYKKGTFEQKFWDMFSAYEDLLLDNAKPVIRLNKTRGEALEFGEIKALENWVEKSWQHWAFDQFITLNKSRKTAEGLVLECQDLFAPYIIKTARLRIEDAKLLQ